MGGMVIVNGDGEGCRRGCGLWGWNVEYLLSFYVVFDEGSVSLVNLFKMNV